MVNLVLMHVTVPANALIGCTIIRPFVEFRFQKEFDSDFNGYDELRYASEEKMAYFGQRFTYGYETYNLFFNIGTMGHIMMFFLLYVLTIYIILRATIHM